MCDLDVMGAPSKLSVIRKAADLGRPRPTFLLIWVEKTLFFIYFIFIMNQENEAVLFIINR